MYYQADHGRAGVNVTIPPSATRDAAGSGDGKVNRELVLATALMPQRGECVDTSLGHGQGAAGFACFGVTASAD